MEVLVLAPNEIAKKTIEVGKTKANLTAGKMLLLGIFAGIFIALAGVGATIGNVVGGKLIGALIFPIGLAMVIVAGSELFTGNNLMITAWPKGKITLPKLLKNWLLVFIGNFLGALLVAFFVVYSGVLDGAADTVINTAITKELLADKPSEIMRLSLLRAKFAENLAKIFELAQMSQELFLMGLFSVLDIMLDKTMDEALEIVKVSKPISDALLRGEGPLAPVLNFVKEYENASWQEVSRLMVLSNIDMDLRR